MERKIYTFSEKRINKFNYLLHIPKDFKEGMPLIIALHGAGERGDDFNKISVHGLPKYIEGGMDIPAVVAAPQCPDGLIWNLLTFELREFTDYLANEYKVDKSRISITGLSMGGYGTWEMLMSYPGYFYRAAPICGGGVSWRAELVGKTPVWAFHGDKDSCVPIGNSLEMCERAKAAGGNVKLTVLHGVDHNSWEPAYEESRVIDFLAGKYTPAF